eukprot:Skav232914  [mRNA]  locus=scaffold1477:629812:630351:- [translate_table: standard]
MDPRECIQTRPQLKDTQKPMCLSMVDDATWNDWIGKLAKIVKSYWNQLPPAILFLFFSILMIIGFFASQPWHWVGYAYALILVLPIIWLTMAVAGFRYIHGKNQALDQQIHGLCQQLSFATWGTVRVEYRHARLDLGYKAPDARICRLVAFVPLSAAVIPAPAIPRPVAEAQVVGAQVA